jgi:hypothetical protein
MRKLLVIGAGLFLSLATPAGAQGAGDAHGTGAGRTTLGMEHFELSAHDRGLIGDFGKLAVKVSTPTQQISYSVDVTCVHLSFDVTEKGVLQGTVTRVTPVPNLLGITAGSRRFTQLSDNGNPSSGAPVDYFDDLEDFFPPDSCHSIFFVGGTAANVEEGNVNIKLPD